ncbi:hypothetical protein [Cedecea sp. FDAARGOS_727]|uniref:hypothetical protein n=1 Tax=Cedecea sp. FDAARGOS_727 TaxID=2545798 RepID=UPI00143EE3BD|nr:hypothetical protein [Cedecea sp. FDAARGOS_727]QIX94794.1 hypothetical protein FOC35_03445 [Cedecea sp. FDAARGOS_727]
MKGMLFCKGISLLEVAFFLIALTILSLFVAEQISIRSKYLESKIISDQVRAVSDALNAYLENLKVSDDTKFPLEVKISTLVKSGYLPHSKYESDYLTGSENNYIIKLQATGNQPDHLVGMTLLCLSNIKKLSVINNLGFSGGVVSINGSSMVTGALGGWAFNRSDYPSIFNDPLIKNINDCVFNLSSWEPIIDESDYLNKPTLSSDKLNIQGLVAGEEVSLLNGGIWNPLYRSDALIVTNNSINKDIVVEVIDVDSNNIITRGHYMGTENKIFISEKYIGMKIILKIIPVDPAGHEGDAIVMPQNGSNISIEDFNGSLFHKISFKVQANLFNHDFSVPVEPKNNTRSDTGECSDVQKTGDNPAGIDVEGVQLDLVRSKEYSPYLIPHVISLLIDNQSILTLKISNPSTVPFRTLSWGTYDRRDNHSPLIPGVDVSGNGFSLITGRCLKSDSKNIRFGIRIDKHDYSLSNQHWDGGSPLWKPIFVTLTGETANIWRDHESIYQ